MMHHIQDQWRNEDVISQEMFDCGVIGNSGRRMTFKFLGDRDLSPMDDMIFHRPLRNFFGVKSR